MLFPRFVVDGNENLILGSYFTRFWAKIPVSFVPKKGKRKRSFSFPSSDPQ